MDTILSRRAALLNLFTCSSANTLNHVGKINSYLRFIISVHPVAGLELLSLTGCEILRFVNRATISPLTHHLWDRLVSQ